MQIFSFYLIRISLDTTGFCSFAVNVSPAVSQFSCRLQYQCSYLSLTWGKGFSSPYLHSSPLDLLGYIGVSFGESPDRTGECRYGLVSPVRGASLPGAAAVLQPGSVVPPKGSSADSRSAILGPCALQH